jgi:ferrous iron transport protein B
MAMGIGCNACGVTGCRIIESPKERLIAILTNNFMPCNGRFPILIAVITIFFTSSLPGLWSSAETALILVLIIILCCAVTLIVSKLLSKALKEKSSSGFILELPPYRKPQLCRTLVRSILDRTIFVLGRAVAVAAPAGAVIWLFANINIGNSSILQHCISFLDPFGRFIGLDGVILMAFILGFPANETVIPIIIMSYSASGVLSEFTGYNELYSILSQNGWGIITAVCMIIMTVMHFPCSTTCLTIKKETGSLKWTLLSMLIPTAIGISLCAVVAFIYRLFA